MPKILIIEDDATTAHAYRSTLERAGYTVLIPADGEEGLDYIQAVSPDAVLLDLMMPNVNCIELLLSIRECPHLAQIPILALASSFVPDLVNEARAAGATDVFCKSQLTPQILAEAFDISMKSWRQADMESSPSGYSQAC